MIGTDHTTTVLVAQADVANRNQRIYPRDVLEDVVAKAQKRIKAKAFRCELGFPIKTAGQSTDDFMRRVMTVDERQVSHEVVNLRLDDDGFLLADIRVLNTPNGQVLQKVMERESMDFRFRGFMETAAYGTTMTMVKKFDLVSIDAVRDGA